MLDNLKQFQQTRPDWLMQLPGPLTLPLLRVNLAQLLNNALVYPGSGNDWSPIRQTIGIVHSYVFFTYHPEREKMLQLLCSSEPVAGIGHLYCDVLKFETSSLNLNNDALRECHLPNREMGLDDYDHGSGLWAIYDTLEHGRVSILILQQEAINAIAALFVSNNIAPKILVLQDHKLGGNCWPSFGEPYHCLISQLNLAWPEILIVGNDDYEFHKKNNYQMLCEDMAIEAQHGNNRKICVLGNNGEPSTPADELSPADEL